MFAPTIDKVIAGFTKQINDLQTIMDAAETERTTVLTQQDVLAARLTNAMNTKTRAASIMARINEIIE
jgi:hypothetical protein